LNDELKWTRSEAAVVDEPSTAGVGALTAVDIGVVFQPIVSIATGRLFAHEVLTRCKRPEYANPVVLFQKAAAEGACGRLGRLIRDAAFLASGDVALFVNIHPDELSSHWLVRPDDPLGFHTKLVFLEITESAAFTHFDRCLGVLKELCARSHARLVIDDFGAGYSNLERLVDLEPAVVKLDLTLTRDIHLRPRKKLVVAHMVNLCRDLGATVVAEGVETLDELKCVRDLGVEYAQGYLLARPAMPPPAHVWPLGTPAPMSVRRPMPSIPAAVPTRAPSKRPPPRRSAAPHARKTKPPQR
jgi:EAL domain-containing protein (putative c-di-GMP-specific phosphodiesterase class I)